jgi:serine protease AprX
MLIRRLFCLILISLFALNTAQAGILFSKSNGVTLTGADGVTLTGMDGVTLTGADGFLTYKSNGVTLTGADGVTLTGADGVTLTGADGATYIGQNGVTLTGADGVTLTGADGVTLTGADGVTLTGADGTTYTVDSINIVNPNGVTLTGADGVTLTGADGVTLTGADGVTLTGADGVTLTGADGVTLTGADSITGFDTNGVVFNLINPQGVTLTGADGIAFTSAQGIRIIGAEGVTLTGADDQIENNTQGINSIDPELAILLNNATDDSNINAVLVFHNLPDENDLNLLRQIGIVGGTRFKVLPMIVVTATRRQLIAVSRLTNVRSIYGNRTLSLNSDPFFKNTGIQKVAPDRDLQTKNGGMPVSGRNITVAVLDTGVNSQHNDLAGKVIQNVKLADTQSLPLGFANPTPVENVVNTDPISGHGTFVSGVIAASGVSSGGKYDGVAPGAKILGLSAGDLNLFHVLSGFDYVLERGANYNVRVVNCSFSANTVFDYNDPVNVATKMLTDRGINVVVSAGNSGSGNGSLNPYAAAPWVVSVGATDEKGRLANFSSRGVFGSQNQRPTIVATGVNVVSLRSLGTQTGTLGIAGADLQRLTPGEIPFYTTASGTSFSAPQVAGAIALMLEANPELTPAEVKDILQRTATPLPEKFSHEVGAGVLNTYASVLESAFPTRRMGLYRSILNNKSVKFKNSVAYTFEETVNPGSARVNQFPIAADTIQAGINIVWGMSANDLSLKLYDSQSNLIGNSNSLNLPGLTGTSEKITLNNPSAQNYRAVVQHSNNIGISQRYFVKIETTQIEFSGISDLETISPQMQSVVKESLRKFLVSAQGSKFHPNFTVTRAELAESLLRSGTVLQYVAANPIFPDVKNLTVRTAVESVHSDKLFYDATNGYNFRPNDSASKLITAVALVKAAGLEGQTYSASLPSNMTDASSIPSQYRGYIAIALQKGFVTIDGNKFNPNRALTRVELSLGMVNLVRFVNQ